MRAGTGRRSARARGKKVRNRMTFQTDNHPTTESDTENGFHTRRPFSVFSRMHKRPQCRCRIPTSGNDTGPLRGGVAEQGSRGHGLETRRTETRKLTGRRHAGRRRGSMQLGDANDPQPAKMRQIRKTPYPTSSRNSARCVHYKQKARSQKRPGPVLMYGAATLRRQRAPRLRQPTHTTSNRCTHRQARHMPQAPKRLPAPRRARA